jgi:phosphopantetheinyl transferase (holo-ACP synthase)
MMYVKRIVLKKLEDMAWIPEAAHGFRDSGEKGWLTEAELEYCANRLRCLGARFLVKECIFDYLEKEAGYVKKDFREIEIINNELRKPIVKLLDGLNDCAGRLRINDILVSISHSRNWITGMVLFCY